MESCQFRDMTLADLPAVLAVESDCYEFPWSERVFRDCLQAGYVCRLAELAAVADGAGDTADTGNTSSSANTKLVGHGILMMGPGEAHVLNICVVAECRSSGLAGRLLQSLIVTAQAESAREVFLEVRQSNLAAMRLYEAHGFNRIAIRENYYNADCGREDAILYALTLPDPATTTAATGDSTANTTIMPA